MGRSAAKTRAYNKAFKNYEVKCLEAIGAVRFDNGLFRMPSGQFISAGPGRPGKVHLLLQSREGIKSRTFGIKQLEEMKLWAEGKPTAADRRAALTKAAPKLLEVLKQVTHALGTWRNAPTPAIELFERAHAVIKEAEGEE